MLKDVRIPLAPLIPHIRDHLHRTDTFPTQFDRELRVPVDTTRILLLERSRTIEFNLADKIVCCINPFLWRSDDELARIYQEVDFSKAREYDEETQFPCGHPRVESNTRHHVWNGKSKKACVTCNKERTLRNKHKLRDQLSLIRDAA